MDLEAKKALGARIKEKREKLGLSQLELAQSINKQSSAYIAFIEAGERNISTMDLMLLSKSLGTNVSALLGESNEPSRVDVMEAFRRDKDLTPNDRKVLEDLYQVYKKRHRDE